MRAYVEALGAALDERGWSLVQPVLSSSYAGFGCSSLQRDADELAPLRHTHARAHTHTKCNCSSQFEFNHQRICSCEQAQLLRHIADREDGGAEFALVGATTLSAGTGTALPDGASSHLRRCEQATLQAARTPSRCCGRRRPSCAAGA